MKVDIGTNRFTEIEVCDEAGSGGAHHKYRVIDANDAQVTSFAMVKFQNGPVNEGPINGCHNEDLLAIVIHRLQCFQSGAYACRENALALTKLEEAMHWLNHRTQARQKRGVEGTHTV